MREKLNLYRIDMKYIRNLHKVDDKIPSVSPQIGKDTRLFLGIFNLDNEHKYVIPLSHPTEKHNRMAPRADFDKIYDNKGKLIAVLNLNLMIPIEEPQLIPINLKISKKDSPKDKAYKRLCSDELRYCRKEINAIRISNKVQNLYNLCTDFESEYKGKSRCLNFKKLETTCEKYNKKLKSHA